MTEPMTDLLPCPNPWCKGDPKIHHDPDRGTRQGYCAECGVEAPVANNEAEAITAWNTRTGQLVERDGVARVVEALEAMRSDCQTTIDQYERNGPTYTSPAGEELEPTSFVQARMVEIVERCSAALTAIKGGGDAA